jgi:glycine reductase
MIRVVMFLNQVLVGYGGDERMNIPPQMIKGAVGPGMILKPRLAELGAEAAGVVVCGDNYFLKNKEDTLNILIDMIKELKADVVVAGPALDYKRYGECCGHLVKALEARTKIPAFAAMAVNSSGTEMFRKDMYIIETPRVGGLGLNASLKRICSLAVKMAKNETIGSSSQEGYFSRE